MTRSASIWRASSSACSGLGFAAGFRRSWGSLWRPARRYEPRAGEPEDFKWALAGAGLPVPGSGH
jgi:hypothetical protein